MGMIEQIIADAKTMEADAIKAETDSQKAYACCIENTAVTGSARRASYIVDC